MKRCWSTVFWILLFLAIAVPCSYGTSYAQDCHPLQPHQAVNSEVSNEIKANAALRWKIGSGEFENQYKKVQEDVLSKYPNADRLYIWSEFIYLECTLLEKSHFSDAEKQRQFQLLMDKATQGPPAEMKNEGYISPGDEPSPPISCPMLPKDALVIYFGKAAVSYAPSGFEEHTVFRINGEKLLWLTRDKDGVNVSAEIFDNDGILAEINNKTFKVYRDDFIKHPDQPDPHTLIVYDKWNHVRLHVHYLNPKAIDITGVFFYPGQRPIVADGTSLRVPPLMFNGGICIGGNSRSDVNLGG